MPLTTSAADPQLRRLCAEGRYAFRIGGRDFRLSDVHGHGIREIRREGNGNQQSMLNNSERDGGGPPQRWLGRVDCSTSVKRSERECSRLWILCGDVFEGERMLLQVGPRLLHEVLGNTIRNRLLQIDSHHEERWKARATPEPPSKKVCVGFRGVALPTSPNCIISAVGSASVGRYDVVNCERMSVATIHTLFRQSHADSLVAHERLRLLRAFGITRV